MSRTHIIIAFSVLVISGIIYAKQAHLTSETTLTDDLKNGDIIFHTSKSGQSKAIQLATNSPYSHCGIIYSEKDQFYVFEAVQPVKKTPLSEWVARGTDGRYVIKRLKNADKVLTEAALQKMKEEGQKFMGKNYDKTFEWSDEKIYCSELVWKIYKRSLGIDVGKLEKLRDFDLSSKTVKSIMASRYGKNIPLNETVISPVSIFNSDLLMTVKEK